MVIAILVVNRYDACEVGECAGCIVAFDGLVVIVGVDFDYE